jgi:5-methylcytosine-specific restriction endonuclease McrA
MAHASAKVCSEKCKRVRDRAKPGVYMWHNWKQRRRAKGLPVGERLTPSVADIVQRDGLDCHICLQPIDYTLEWKDWSALTVDHLIPVSDARSFHALENLKLAHRGCNLLRSDHIYNDRSAA